MDVKEILSFDLKKIKGESNKKIITYINFLADEFERIQELVKKLDYDIENMVITEDDFQNESKKQSFKNQANHFVPLLDKIELKQAELILELSSRVQI